MPADLTPLWQRKASGITVQNDGTQTLGPEPPVTEVRLNSAFARRQRRDLLESTG
jgi:hypothetical protein